MNAAGEPALLTVVTSVGTVEVRGPNAPPAGLMRGLSKLEQGKLDISGVESGSVSATYLDSKGSQQTWEAVTGTGPLLFEEQTYHLWADGNEYAPTVQHRDPLFARDITHRPERRTAAGTFNLQRQVGKLAFAIAFGPTVVRIELEVVPTKIDYATDYQSLVSEVTGIARGLALAYMRSTHRGALHTGERASEIEWLTTLRQEIARLWQAINRINIQPYRHLLRESRPTANHKIRRLNAATRRAIACGKGSGVVDEIDGLGPVRRIVESINAVATLDTPEHRWIHLHLRTLHRQIQLICALLQQEAEHSIIWIGERRRAEAEELRQMTEVLERLLDLEVLRHATRPPQPSPPSLTLISAPGYRDAYRILTELRLGLSVGGQALELQTKDIHDLYELWAFVEIVRLVAEDTSTNPDPTSLIRHYGGGLRIDLQAGSLSDVSLAGDARSFTVSYNRVYPGQTGNQKPDIVIRVSENGQPDLIIVLDAKYRVDATSDFRSRYGSPGPPIDAINALHRYRDAIVTDNPGPTRPVVRGAALFPLTVEETDSFESDSHLYASLSRLGIGALPFLPGNTRLAATWLAHLLALPINELAWNGPPSPDIQVE